MCGSVWGALLELASPVLALARAARVGRLDSYLPSADSGRIEVAAMLFNVVRLSRCTSWEVDEQIENGG